jgi:hypothetical protein
MSWDWFSAMMSEKKYCPSVSGNSKMGFLLTIGTVIGIMALVSATLYQFIPFLKAQDQNQTTVSSVEDINNISADNQTNSISQEQEDFPLTSKFVGQGMISSITSFLTGREDVQTAVILPPREDAGLYSGILTFHSSRPVDVVSWNIVDPINVTQLDEFGNRDDIVSMEGADIALTELGSSSDSGSVLFTGNVLELVGGEDPFIVTYTVSTSADNATQVNNVQDLTSEISQGIDETNEE